MKKKNIYYIGLICVPLIIILILSELTGLLFVSLHINDTPSRSQILKTLDNTHFQEDQSMVYTSEKKMPGWMKPHILHPYLGFVRNPELPRQVFNNQVINMPVNEYGFFGNLPEKTKSKDKITIAIMGGSVAFELFYDCKDSIKNELKNSQKFKDKEIEIVCLALGGMKQPQQLMTLNYFLTLGYHFDMVINCDGFNEVALPYAQNLPYNVSPFYPRAWGVYATKSMNVETAVFYGKTYESKQKQERWRTRISKSPYRYSNFCLLLWTLINNHEYRLQYQYDKNIRELEKLKKHQHPQETGPAYTYGSASEIFSDLAEMWKNSSVLMWKTCRSNQIEYFHFLQPNQYVQNSKNLNEWEKKHIFGGPNNLSRQSVEKGYPPLKDAGEELSDMGIRFYDLTNTFKNHQESIYKDNSCHLNKHGNRLLAKCIVNWLLTV